MSIYWMQSFGVSKNHIKLNYIILYHFTKLRSIYVILETFYALYYVSIFLSLYMHTYKQTTIFSLIIFISQTRAALSHTQIRISTVFK